MMTSWKNTIRLPLCAALAAFALAAPAFAQDANELRERQAAQQRAQAMTRDMVTGIFDVQLRQLAENGLTGTELYTDIAAMRDHVDLLVDEEMSEVIDLLAQAQRAEGDERRVLTEDAREKAREVLVVLMAERQKLRRRLQISNIAAQVETLLVMQTGLYDRTVTLSESELAVQEAQAIGTIADQRDIKALYFELVETLNDVSGWGGDLGVGAQDGLRILRAAGVENHLEDAVSQLEIMEFAPASESQLDVLQGLEALMLQVQETQGLIKSNREAILESVRDLIARQTALRQETSAESLTDSNVNPLITEQNAIHQAIGQLDRQLDVFPGAPLLLEQAKAAAYEASGKIFDLDQSAAVAFQSDVIANLEQLTQRLEDALELDGRDLSADELEEVLEKIAEAREKLEEATPFEEQALAAAEADPLAAAKAQLEAAREMREAAEEERLPASAASRLREAAEEAEQAAEALEEAAEKPDDLAAAQAALRALENALDAHERAAAELAAQQADTERSQLAVEVGELARAAEALERAAAAERRVGDRSIEAAEAGGYDAEQLDALVLAHQQVTQVVEHVGAGVVNTAPSVAQLLAEAAGPLSQVAGQLEQAGQMPAEASIVPATQVSVQAEIAADLLVDAAAVLRALAGESAEELAEIAGEQLQQVNEARREIDELVEEVRQPAEDTANLQKALAAVLRGEESQYRAMGREEAAALESLVLQIEQAITLQGVADRAANELASGRANTPLEATDRQQRSADHLAELAQAAPAGPLSDILARANAAAQQAARHTLAGNASGAASARQQTTAILSEALEQAQQATAAALAAPAAEADPLAQQAVSLECNEARQALGDAAPDAAELIESARRSSLTATQQLGDGNAAAALPLQEECLADLVTAEGILRKMLADAAAQESEELSKAAEEAGDLAREASEIDPDAADALRDAQRGAEAAMPQEQPQSQSPQSQPTPQEQQEAREKLADDLQRSSASMAAREEQIRRDQGVAEALAELAERQQEARDQIEESAQELEEAARERAEKKAEAEANGEEPPSEEPTDEEKEAAQDLNRAMREFAQTQKATGQGAEEISQQQQVENEELKKGLEAASQLPEAAMPPPPEEEEDEDKPEADFPPPTPDGGEGGDGNSPGMGSGSAPAGMGGDKPPMADPDAPPNDSPPGSGNMPPTGLPPTGEPNPNSGSGGSESGTGPPPPDTGLTPESPEMTAQQIAGKEAMEQALQAMQDAAQGQSESQSQSPSNAPSGGGGGMPPPGPSQDQSTAPPGEPKPSPGGLSPHDVDPETREGEEDPWFADLPPEIQEAIHSGSQGRSPRGYEERLRLYHQSTE